MDVADQEPRTPERTVVAALLKDRNSGARQLQKLFGIAAGARVQADVAEFDLSAKLEPEIVDLDGISDHLGQEPAGASDSAGGSLRDREFADEFEPRRVVRRKERRRASQQIR
ncbi:MAG TPA: hypothetical protein VK197_03265, partial [Verrucomicrobiae bacterium]|nr:hypothetical protein [Verrucomicrobiae bacterium]